MFGTNKYKEVKTTKFKSDNERKKYFAIKNYYKNNPSSSIYSKSTKSTRNKINNK